MSVMSINESPDDSCLHHTSSIAATNFTHARPQALTISDFLHVLPLITDVASNPAVFLVFVFVI